MTVQEQVLKAAREITKSENPLTQLMIDEKAYSDFHEITREQARLRVSSVIKLLRIKGKWPYKIIKGKSTHKITEASPAANNEIHEFGKTVLSEFLKLSAPSQKKLWESVGDVIDRTMLKTLG